ncbi:MAG: hypothetical protein RIR26_1128 [Pseudomonadota bacterium]|jgi:hypothetical protein
MPNLKFMRFNPSAPPSSQLTLLSALIPTFSLILTVFALMALPKSHPRDTLLVLWSESNLFRVLRKELVTIPIQADLEELKCNFLANRRISDPLLKFQFQSSGLTHLLAISGGQTGPAAFALTHSILSIVILIWGKRQKHISMAALKFIRNGGAILQFGVVLFLVGLYQSTGALGRVLSFTTIKFFLFTAREANSYPASRAVWLSLLWPALPWLTLALIGQNPATDLSFQLSLLGGLVLKLSSHLVAGCLKENEKKGENENNFASKMQKLLFTFSIWVTVTAATSCFMSLLCSVYWPSQNIMDQIQANLIAGPLVLIFITPLSLAIDFAVLFQWHMPVSFLCKLFSYALHALKCIAEAFSAGPASVPPAESALALAHGLTSHPEKNSHHFLFCIVLVHLITQATGITMEKRK